MKLLFSIFVSVLSASVIADVSPVEYSPVPAVDCVINPYRVADLASPVPGVIETVHVERSQQVSAGQVVAQLDAGVERASVELTRYRAAIKSEIKLGELNLDYDTRRKKRVDSLHEKKVVSIENTDEAKREAGLSRWELEQAREMADIRKLELQRAEEQLKQKMIRAPFAGYVLDTFKYRGEYVEDQAIVRLAQLDPLVVEAIVPMESFGKVKAGMLAEIMPEILSEEKLTGKVTIVDRIGDTASNTFGVRLILPNPENRIPAGLKCVVRFLEETAEDTLDVTAEKVDTGNELVIPGAKADESARANVAANVTASVDEAVFSEPTGLFNRETLTDESPVEVLPVIEASEKPVQKPSSYLVLTAQQETAELKASELISKLKEAGINDLHEIARGTNKGQVALGLYSKQRTAEKRQRELEKLGFTTIIRERY